jgi:hypothetical protein
MVRERFRDDNREDYDEQPRRKSGGNKGLIIGLIVGGVLLLVFVLVGGTVAYVLFDRAAAVPAPANAPAPVADVPAADAKKAPMGKGVEAARPPKEVKVYTRDEFTTLVAGKTMEEVKALLGNPTITKRTGLNADPTWSYDGVTIDAESGKIDRSVHLVFRGGKVFSVTF